MFRVQYEVPRYDNRDAYCGSVFYSEDYVCETLAYAGRRAAEINNDSWNEVSARVIDVSTGKPVPQPAPQFEDEDIPF
jgi:hypothetical protein